MKEDPYRNELYLFFSLLSSVQCTTLGRLISDAVGLLEPLECKVITLRYGLKHTPTYTVEETADVLHIPLESVHRVEKSAVWKLHRFINRLPLLPSASRTSART